MIFSKLVETLQYQVFVDERLFYGMRKFKSIFHFLLLFTCNFSRVKILTSSVGWKDIYKLCYYCHYVIFTRLLQTNKGYTGSYTNDYNSNE